MATIDEIFENMPAEASVTYEELIIDAEARQIIVPDAEAIFGVESDTHSERKHFRCPRYVGDGLDLASCFLRVNFRNANGDVDSYLIEDTAIDGDDITFSWELSRKVTAYKGAVKFNVCAIMGAGLPEWNTTLAEGLVLEGLEPDSSTVEAETADVIAQLLATVVAQTAAVEVVGAAQRAEVQKVGENTTEEAKAAVEAKGEAVKASIPEDYSTLFATVDKLTRDRAAAIVCEAEGETIQVADSSADSFVGLRIFGKSTQDGTPTPDAPVEIVSAKAPTVTVCGKNLCPESALDNMGMNGSSSTYDAGSRTITMTSNPTGFAGCYCAPFKNMIVGKSYTISFSIRGTAGRIVKCGWDKNGVPITLTNDFRRYAVTLAATKANEPIVFYSRPTSNGGLSAGEYMQFSDVQIEVGNAATEYEPYKEAQTLTLSTPDSLPGIPVTSGGNYTDANGQQWISDEIDLARGVYVQRIGSKVFEGSEDENWTASSKWYYLAIHDKRNNRGPVDSALLCDLFSVGRVTASQVGQISETYYSTGNVNILVNYDGGEGGTDNFKAWLQSNPMTVYYLLATPIETPLFIEELEAYKALLANKPTTTVLNDAGAWMALEYAADPKTYIDNKIAALLAAKN